MLSLILAVCAVLFPEQSVLPPALVGITPIELAKAWTDEEHVFGLDEIAGGPFVATGFYNCAMWESASKIRCMDLPREGCGVTVHVWIDPANHDLGSEQYVFLSECDAGLIAKKQAYYVEYPHPGGTPHVIFTWVWIFYGVAV